MRALARMAAVVAALLLVMALGAPAFAVHKHWIQTPGTCVTDIASGQTAQSGGGGFHRFHDNVHAGTALSNTSVVTVGTSATGACP